MDEASSVSGSVASMKKWGIPHQKAPEITLLERLVWVKYRSHWWPALLYHSYSELQHHLYDQLDMVLKAQFAMAIMRQVQEKKKIKVARLLGRSMLEVVEVEEDSFCEFYWQLPNVLPNACRKSHYDGDHELYFDFHRALDQVEDIIREVSQENFALFPNSEQQTWLDRANAAFDKSDDEMSIASGRDSQRSSSRLGRSPSFESRDGNSTVATNEVSVWSSGNHAGNESPHGNGVEARLRGKDPSKLKRTKSKESKYFPSRNGVISDISINSSMISTQSRASGTSDFPRHHDKLHIGPNPSHLSKSSSRSSKNSSKEWDAKSRRSSKSKVSQANTEKIDNRTMTRQSKNNVEQFPPPPGTITRGSTIAVDETRDPADEDSQPEIKTTSAKAGKLHTAGAIANAPPDSRAPQPPRPESVQSHATSTNTANASASTTNLTEPSSALVKKRVSPIQVLPGLEGDDIIPGLSAHVAGARSTWMNVLGFLNDSREDPNLTEVATEPPLDASSRHPLLQIDEEKLLTTTEKGGERMLPPPAGGSVDEGDQLVEQASENLSFWQRFACGAVG